MYTLESQNGVIEHYQGPGPRDGFISRHRASDKDMCILCAQKEVSIVDQPRAEPPSPKAVSQPETTVKPESGGRQTNSETTQSAAETTPESNSNSATEISND